MLTGCSDATEKRWNGSDSLGGEHSVLVNSVQRGHPINGSRWPSLADASQQGVIPARIHVQHVLRLPDILESTTAMYLQSNNSRPNYSNPKYQTHPLLYLSVTERATSVRLIVVNPVRSLGEFWPNAHLSLEPANSA